MAEPDPDTLARSQMRRLALSRWENEGGASPCGLVAGSTVPTLRLGRSSSTSSRAQLTGHQTTKR